MVIFQGVVLKDGDRILVKDEVDQVTNGIYVYVASDNSLIRARDWSPNAKMPIPAGTAITILNGDDKGTTWSLLKTVYTVNVDPAIFTETVFVPVYTAGTGISIVNKVISLINSAITSVGTIRYGTWNGSTITTFYGGTGLTSIGSAGTVLTVTGGVPAWAAPFLGSGYTAGAGIAISLGNVISIISPISLSNGGTGISTVGTNGQVLTSNGVSSVWTSPSIGSVNSVTATSGITVTGSSLHPVVNLASPMLNSTIVSHTNTVAASQLMTSGADVVIVGSAPPIINNGIVATSATTANWANIVTSLTAGTGINIVGTTVSILTPLSVVHGGTNLTSVGADGTILTISGGVPAWIAPSADTSGTYTPTVTADTNCASTAAYLCKWIRIGNEVTVSGAVRAVATFANLPIRWFLSIPIASTVTNFYEIAGSGANSFSNLFGPAGVGALPCSIQTDVITPANRAMFYCDASGTVFLPTTASESDYVFVFMYIVQ